MFHIVIAKNLSNLQNLNPRKFSFGSSFMLSVSSKPNCQLSLYGSHTCGWQFCLYKLGTLHEWWVDGLQELLIDSWVFYPAGLMRPVYGFSLQGQDTRIKTPQKVCVEHLKSPKERTQQHQSPD
jgi:hypothetical protein